MLRQTIVAVALFTSSAFADTAADITARVQEVASKSSTKKPDAPKFAFTSNLTVQTGSLDDFQFGLPEIAIADKAKTTVATSGDSIAWVSANLGEFAYCAKPGCPKQTAETWLRATVLFEKSGTTWQPLAWSMTPPIPGGDQVQAMAEGRFPDKLDKDVTGAEDVSIAFQGAMADPKVLVAAVSARKDVVLYGSEMAERYVGPAVAKTLGGWNIKFALRDGIRAGVSKNGTAAWVAANVDGTFVKNPKMKPVPYRVFAIYEKDAKLGWKIVALQFSTAV